MENEGKLHIYVSLMTLYYISVRNNLVYTELTSLHLGDIQGS